MTDVQDKTVAATPVEKSAGSLVATLFRFQSVFGLLAVFLAAIIFSPRKDGEILFISADNLANVVRAVSEIGIIAVGMTFVILIGGIDLSVGAVLGLAAVGSAVLMVENDWGFLPSVLLVLVIGLIFGALQGVATAMIGIQSFIVTLAGLQIARGLARIWSGGRLRRPSTPRGTPRAGSADVVATCCRGSGNHR